MEPQHLWFSDGDRGVRGVLSGATESGLPATASAVCLGKMSVLPYLAVPGNCFNEGRAAAKRALLLVKLSPRLK